MRKKREDGGGDCATFCFDIGNFGVFERQETIRIVLSKRHDLGEPVFKNPGR